MMKKGRLFVISAPSGTGKSTVLACVRKRLSYLEFSVSCTTRERRQGEVAGVDYRFVGRDDFRKMADDGGFVEWAEVHGELYGTPRAPIEDALSSGSDMILDIDVQGGMAIKDAFPDAIAVFLLPPDMEELERRLSGRATDSEDQIRLRLENARREMSYAERYDRRIVNDEVGRACEELCDLIDGTRESRVG